jgi:hypothetical protein
MESAIFRDRLRSSCFSGLLTQMRQPNIFVSQSSAEPPYAAVVSILGPDEFLLRTVRF